MEHLKIALKEYGTWEWQGLENNPQVLKYSKEIGLTWVKDDETAWCALFVNWCLMKAKLPHTGAANARSFLTYGVSTKTPELGDIVVFWRGSKTGALGHVAIFIKETANSIYVLGGNQNEQVNISAYSKAQVLDYRKVPLINNA